MYTDILDFLGKNISVASTQGPSQTRIRPIGTLSAVNFRNGETQQAVLQGFDIAFGGPTDYGGGIFIDGASPTIIENNIHGNEAGIRGGGIYAVDSNAIIARNRIAENLVFSDFQAIEGGGIFAQGGVQIFDNVIEGNSLDSSYGAKGGGVFSQGLSHIHHNAFVGNVAEMRGGGGGLHHRGGYCLIADNEFRGNFVGWFGEGGAIRTNGPVDILRNRFLENRAHQYSGGGGAVTTWGGRVTMANNLFAGNSGPQGATYQGYGTTLRFRHNTVVGNRVIPKGNLYDSNFQIWYSTQAEVSSCLFWNNDVSENGHEFKLLGQGDMTIRYSDLQGGMDSVRVFLGSDLEWGAGMIDAAPRFAGGTVDVYRPAIDSPLVDSGDPLDDLCERDNSGVPRWLDSRGTSLQRNDIGAFEVSLIYLGVDGDLQPGGQAIIETSGTPGTQAFLFVATASGANCQSSLGPMFFDFSSPWLLIPWGTVPRTVALPIPPSLPTPFALVPQGLGMVGTGGSTSNDMLVRFE